MSRKNIDIDVTTITQAARAVDLDLASEHLPGVLHYYRMIADFAATVGAFPLNENDEPAAVFVPCPAKTRE
jgi:hypothetical protein